MGSCSTKAGRKKAKAKCPPMEVAKEMVKAPMKKAKKRAKRAGR
jgi:hypothetical protein